MSEWREVDVNAVYTAKEASRMAPRIFGVPTGVEGLDDLFFIMEYGQEGPRRVVLGGVPYRAVINITGIPDTGKSLLVEQFAVKQASLGYPVAFITVESPAPFVSTGLYQRAAAMNIEREAVDENIILIDAASSTRLREDVDMLLDTLAYTIREYSIKNVVIDSVTGLFEAREMLARNIVRKLFNFLKKWGQTALLVSQKRSAHEETSAEAAGGYAVSHILDGTIVLSKKVITPRDARMFNFPVGDVLRTIRIDGMRLCGHDTKTHVLEITEAGLVRVGPPLSELVRR